MFCLALVCLSVRPAWGVSKEIIQLQTQVQALQDQMSRMQQSFDERMGVMKNLMDQNTDSMNKVTTAIVNLQTLLQKQAVRQRLAHRPAFGADPVAERYSG